MKLRLLFQPVDVREQLVLIGDAAEVPADHFVSSKRWLTARPQADQHAGDDQPVDGP